MKTKDNNKGPVSKSMLENYQIMENKTRNSTLPKRK